MGSRISAIVAGGTPLHLVDPLRCIGPPGHPVSRLTDMIARAKARDPELGSDLDREFKALSSRLSFGVNFERHRPEAVELPQRPVRKGDKVRVLPDRGATAKSDLGCGFGPRDACSLFGMARKIATRKPYWITPV